MYFDNLQKLVEYQGHTCFSCAFCVHDCAWTSHVILCVIVCFREREKLNNHCPPPKMVLKSSTEVSN